MADSADPTYFFMHIMKTAGTTFTQHLMANFSGNQLHPAEGDKAGRARGYWIIDTLRELSPERRQQIRMYTGHFPYAVRSLVGADVVLTILRDPVERTLAALRHARRLSPKHEGKSLDEIYEDPWDFVSLFRNYQVKQFAMTPEDPLRAHIDGIEIDEARFQVAVAHLDEVDVFGLTERYDEFTDTVHQRYGWRIDRVPDLQVSMLNAPASDALRRRITQDSAADVAFYEHARSVYASRARNR